jgi:hypothetical protein
MNITQQQLEKMRENLKLYLDYIPSYLSNPLSARPKAPLCLT